MKFSLVGGSDFRVNLTNNIKETDYSTVTAVTMTKSRMTVDIHLHIPARLEGVYAVCIYLKIR